jgi:hypothetical protein
MAKTNEKVCTSTHDKPISFLLLGLGQQQIKPDLKLLDPTELGEHRTLTSYDLPCRPWPCVTSKSHRTDHARHMHCMFAAPAAASLTNHHTSIQQSTSGRGIYRAKAAQHKEKKGSNPIRNRDLDGIERETSRPLYILNLSLFDLVILIRLGPIAHRNKQIDTNATKTSPYTNPKLPTTRDFIARFPLCSWGKGNTQSKGRARGSSGGVYLLESALGRR